MSKFDIVRFFYFLGALSVPFTELRFGVIGVGEVSFVICFITYLVMAKGTMIFNKGRHVIIICFVLFFISCIFGLFYNFLILNYVSGNIESAFFDGSAYVVALIVLIVGLDSRTFAGGRAIPFFLTLFYSWFCIYLISYFISQFSDQIFGLQLRYFGNFSPLVSNIHQAAMILCTLPFIALYFLSARRRLVEKCILLITIPIFTAMTIDTGAAKPLLGLIAGSLSFALVVLLRMIKPLPYLSRYVVYVAAMLMFGAFLAAYGEEVMHALVVAFREEDAHEGREYLYGAAITHGMSSFLVGYGFGSQLPLDGKFYDAHSTLLTAYLQGGLIGALGIVFLGIQVLKRSYASVALFSSVCSLGIYLLGGDLLRRLPIWIIVVGILTLAESKTPRPQ